MYKRIVIIFTIAITILSINYGQTQITVIPKNSSYWTGCADDYLKLDLAIKAGTGTLNYFEGWAIFDISCLPPNATFTNLSLKDWTWRFSTSLSHSLYFVVKANDPRTV